MPPPLEKYLNSTLYNVIIPNKLMYLLLNKLNRID